MAEMHKLREKNGTLLNLTVCNRLYPQEAQFSQKDWKGVTCKACTNIRDS